MDRRNFIKLTSAGVVGLTLGNAFSTLQARGLSSRKDYSVILLGDTHFDIDPPTVYHSHFMEQHVNWEERVQKKEFARNATMWRERSRRLTQRAALLADEKTSMVMQMGDLVQGDCGNAEVHQKMLGDALDYFKSEFGNLPFVTVVGNHDIRGVDAREAYDTFMPQRMGKELGKDIKSANFCFNIGDDAYLFIDMNKPDDVEVENMLRQTAGARYTFVVMHAPVFPSDVSNFRWFYHGKNTAEHTEARLHFRSLFAQRNAICICGHTHRTALHDWWGDGGRITQMNVNSVWANEETGLFNPIAEKPEQYGMFALKGKDVKPEDVALFEEYRPGLRTHTLAKSAGSYKLNVSRRGVTVDFYAGDSRDLSHQFKIR